MANVTAIPDLKKSQWYGAAIQRYALHLRICKELDVEPEKFESFAQDVMNAPEAARDEMLDPDPQPPYEPIRRYRQYGAPITSELFTATPPGKKAPRDKPRKKKRKKRVIQQ